MVEIQRGSVGPVNLNLGEEKFSDSAFIESTDDRADLSWADIDDLELESCTFCEEEQVWFDSIMNEYKNDPRPVFLRTTSGGETLISEARDFCRYGLL
jgi:hypothetical protein